MIKAKKVTQINPLSKKNALGLTPTAPSSSSASSTAAPVTAMKASVSSAVNQPVTQPVFVPPSGPLTLQMGGVTHAVDDLIHGYETLVHSLPTISKTVGDMHQNTEALAKHLEVSNYLSPKEVFSVDLKLCFVGAHEGFSDGIRVFGRHFITIT